MKTAWFDEKILPNAMLNSGFKKFEESDHFSSFLNCINRAKDSSSIVDLGCGNGDAATIFANLSYVGADLPHIIDKVAKIKNPNNQYFYFDAEIDDMTFVKDYDIIMMNSFLSEIPNWYFILTKILINAKKYIIIHRQSITKNYSKIEEYNTYGNLKTTNTIINYDDFIKLFEMNNFKKIYEAPSYNNDSNKLTFLFKKND